VGGDRSALPGNLPRRRTEKIGSLSDFSTGCRIAITLYGAIFSGRKDDGDGFLQTEFSGRRRSYDE
jgi:hypothetical protein